MPRIDPNVVTDDQLYGVKEVDNTLSMRDRMAKIWRAHDTVQVKNLDDEALEWQWLSEDDETFVMDDDIKIVTRNKPGLWRLEPGEKDILEGGCAYIMVESLFKKLAVKKAGPLADHPLDEREIKSFSFDDPEAQDYWIARIFQGRMSPHAMQEAVIKSMESTREPSPKNKAKVSERDSEPATV